MDKIRQDIIEGNLTGLYGISQKAILIGGAAHFMLGSACEKGILGEGCFLKHENPSTRGRVANIQLEPIGYFNNPAMGKELLEACADSLIGNTPWYSEQERWQGYFANLGDSLFETVSNRSNLEMAFRWHGLEQKGQPYRIEEIDSKMRIPKDGYFDVDYFDYYEETIIIPFDTLSTPFCGLVDK